MKSLFPEKVHRNIYIGSLIALALGLPLSKFLMSLSQIVMICNWILEGNLKQKFVSLRKNKVALVVCSLLLIHFIGLSYTSDYGYALKDIRIKLPLLVLPLIIATSKPLTPQLYDIILKLFVGSVLIGTGVSIFVLLGIWPHEVNDMRDISIFISHIRFALLICIAIFIVAGFWWKAKVRIVKTAWLLVSIWLLFFLVMMESLTGIVALFIASFIMLLLLVLKSKSKVLKYVTFLVLFITAIGLSLYLKSISDENKPKEKINFNTLDKYTSRGNLYGHDTLSEVRENGYLVWIYYNQPELWEAWKTKSVARIDTLDGKGNMIYFTLIRYLASKGLRKDADAVLSLSDKEIKAIEKGVTNVNYPNMSSVRGRIYETLWEIDLYTKTGEANGHSLTQRFEYWKNALSIIKKHFLFGVGTGDIANAFDEEYEKSESALAQQWRLRSHNQYLSIAVAFGVAGLCCFLFILIYPLKKMGRNNYLYIAFFIVAIISFFTEDTLETQAGVTFYAFFNSFLLFALENNKKHKDTLPPL